MDIEKPQKVVREIVTNVEEEEESIVEERSKLERAVLTRLASPCLQQLEAALQESRSLNINDSHAHKLLMSFRKLLTLYFVVCVYLSALLLHAMAGSSVKCGRMFKCSWHKLLSSGTHPPPSPTGILSDRLPVFMAPCFSCTCTFFRTLFQSEFASFSDLSKEQLLEMFKG